MIKFPVNTNNSMSKKTMSYKIQVKNLENNFIWEKELTSVEFNSVQPLVRGCGVVSVLSATLKPVRSNNLKNFAKDFFLPTLINHAIKVEHTVGKIFLILAALALDTLTFPIRLLTCAPRILSNSRREQNALKTYLVAQMADEKLFRSDTVLVRLEWEETDSRQASRWRTADDDQSSGQRKKQHWLEQKVNFVEVPTYSLHDEILSGFI